MLSEARKFGVSVVLAHQFLGQLDEDLLAAVDGNVSTTIRFRGVVAGIPALAARFGGLVAPEVLMTLPDLSSVIARTAAVGARPHTREVDHNTRTEVPTLHSARWVERMRIATVAPYRSFAWVVSGWWAAPSLLPGIPRTITGV